MKAICAVLLLLVPVLVSAQAKPQRIKLATLLPSGTSGYQALQTMGESWRQAPGGGVHLVIYPGGQQGGESDMVRRMRLGQLQAALISTTGLGEIDRAAIALNNLPLLFRSLEEAEQVRDRLAPELEARILERGFVVLAWCDGGWIHFFSRQPVRSPDDARRLKLFCWAGAPEQEKLARTFGFQPVVLEPTDILVSLQTGMIDLVPSPPFIALAGQYFTAAKYVLPLPYAPLVGAIVVTRPSWDKLPPETQAELRRSAQAAARALTDQSRREMAQSIQAMQARGLQVTELSAENLRLWEEAGHALHPHMRGTLVDAAFYDRLLEVLAEVRAAAPH